MWAISSTTKNKAFLTKVKQRRKFLKVPQKIIAHDLGLSVPAYSKIECGYTDLNFDTFKYLCKTLRIHPQEFVFSD